MENKKILKIASIVILGGIVIGFSIKPIKKMIANYRGDNSRKKLDSSKDSENKTGNRFTNKLKNKIEEVKNKNISNKEIEEKPFYTLEGHSILSSAIQLKQKVGKENFLSKYAGDRFESGEYRKLWEKVDPTKKEVNALYKFLTDYNKNDTETMKSLSEDEQKLVKSIISRFLQYAS